MSKQTIFLIIMIVIILVVILFVSYYIYKNRKTHTVKIINNSNYNIHVTGRELFTIDKDKTYSKNFDVDVAQDMNLHVVLSSGKTCHFLSIITKDSGFDSIHIEITDEFITKSLKSQKSKCVLS